MFVAQNAESKSDFIHKIKIAAKEADETEYRLLLCKPISQLKWVPDGQVEQESVKDIPGG